MRNFKKSIKKTFFIILVLASLTAFLSKYSEQNLIMRTLKQDRIEALNLLQKKKSQNSKVQQLKNELNNSKIKEKEIRERLNMIKKDEVQFIFKNKK